LLTGTQSACQVAADAFRESIIAIARNPILY
jgi:ethanolamine utilization protein EutL